MPGSTSTTTDFGNIAREASIARSVTRIREATCEAALAHSVSRHRGSNHRFDICAVRGFVASRLTSMRHRVLVDR
jgi:hypothetical protein